MKQLNIYGIKCARLIDTSLKVKLKINIIFLFIDNSVKSIIHNVYHHPFTFPSHSHLIQSGFLYCPPQHQIKWSPDAMVISWYSTYLNFHLGSPELSISSFLKHAFPQLLRHIPALFFLQFLLFRLCSYNTFYLVVNH